MTENSVREWVINSYSGYKGLVLQDCEMEEAGPGEVRLRIEAFALNWGDADLMLDNYSCLLYTSPSPRDRQKSRMPSSA